jgi:hypothetical protein
MVEVREVVLVIEVDDRRVVVATEGVLGDDVCVDVDVTVGITYTVAVELNTHPTS